MGQDHDIDTADLHRRAGNMLRVGTIAAVDHDSQRVRVRIAGRVTDWLRWPTEMGRNYRSWRPLREGQQVIVAAPTGDPANGQIVGMLYCDALPVPVDPVPDHDVIRWEDGTIIRHDVAAHHLMIDMRAPNGTFEARTGTSQILMTPSAMYLRADVIHLNDDR